MAMELKNIVPSSLKPVGRRAYHYMLAEYDRQFYERPSASYRREVAARATLPNFLEYAETMCTNGGVIVPNFFGPERLVEMRLEFERLVETNPTSPMSEAEKCVHIATARFTETRLFSELLFEPDLLGLAQYYWGNPVVLNGTGGTRYEPAELEDDGSNQWHHDGKRKQIRVFVFLTDVPEDGQCTKYIAGSHRKYHYDISQSRLNPDDMRRLGEPACCAGPAGSIAIFDTNCAHRADRNMGPRRDTWVYSFRGPGPVSTKLNTVPVLHPDVVKTLNDEQRRIARIA
ncbi:MAG: hypothetical protein HON62_00405 [Rhodospirillaceae bacterium]|jgi:hypothetical protein|nr:hypothetical protein [Rhodospirillaceae bacterium]